MSYVIVYLFMFICYMFDFHLLFFGFYFIVQVSFYEQYFWSTMAQKICQTWPGKNATKWPTKCPDNLVNKWSPKWSGNVRRILKANL